MNKKIRMMEKIFYVFTFLFLLLGNFAIAQSFVICDTECRTFPLGDCTTPHTDSDNIEWPCELNLDDASITSSVATPDDLELLPNIDSLDLRPQIIGLTDPQNRIAMTFADQVIGAASGYKILREWTVIDWITGNVDTYVQIINNTAGILQDCSLLACQANLRVQLPVGNTTPVDIWVTDILVGDYAHCNLSEYLLEITDAIGNVFSGTGMVSTTEAGTYTALITEPTTGNTCWGNLTIVESTTGGNCPLVCNDQIQVALATTATGPSATLTSDVFLEGAYPNCDISTFIIVLTDAAGNTLTGTGEITVTEESSFTYSITDPVSGNSCWGNLIVEDRTTSSCSFEICDTACRTAPLGDCASGHTETDNIEWPCDLTIEVPRLTALDLSPHDLLSVNGVDERDAEPVFVNYDINCNTIGVSWSDIVFDDGINGFTINRTWTILNWSTGDIYEYVQTITNLSPVLLASCKPLECQDVSVVGLGVPGSVLRITARELLNGAYPNCDIEALSIRVMDQQNNMLATGIGTVVLNQPGTMMYSVSELETNNFCRGEITIIPAPTTSSVEEVNALETIKVYPNPATDVLIFDYKNLDLRGNISIAILGQSGRQLLSATNNNRLNISKLNNGLYIYQIKLNDEVRYGKFTVLK